MCWCLSSQLYANKGETMSEFDKLKLKEIIGALRKVRGEMLVCADYCADREHYLQLATSMDYPIQSLEGLAK